jgi:hypothetical protein
MSRERRSGRQSRVIPYTVPRAAPLADARPEFFLDPTQPPVPVRFHSGLCNLPETVPVIRSLFTIDGNQQCPGIRTRLRYCLEARNRLPRGDVFVKDSADPFAALEQSERNTVRRFPSNIYANMFLPKKIYEALPAAYISAGTLFILGALYIGLDYKPMVGYLAVGVSCILAGLTVNSIRRRERSKPTRALA